MSGFIPHSLTPEKREDRVTSCQDIIAMAAADKHITEDETLCSMIPKQSDRVLNGMVRHPVDRRN